MLYVKCTVLVSCGMATTSVLCCVQRGGLSCAQSQEQQSPHLRVNSGNSCQGTTALKSKLMSKLKAW